MPNTLGQHRIVDPVLTTVVQGFEFPELAYQHLFPVVMHDLEGGKVPEFGKEAFMEYNTTRAPRARVQRIDHGTSHVSFQMEEESAEAATDSREAEESARTLRADRTAARLADRVIQLTAERKAAKLATTPATFSGNTTALAAGNKWSADGSKPIDDIEAAKEAVRSKVGIRPNVMVMGPAVYKVLKHHASILERIKYSQKGIATTDLLAQVFDVETVVVAEAITASDAGVFSDLWGKNVILAYVPPKATADLGVPSFGYTFRKVGRPNASKYFDQSVKSEVVQVEDIFVCKVLAPGAGYLIQTAVA